MAAELLELSLQRFSDLYLPKQLEEVRDFRFGFIVACLTELH